MGAASVFLKKDLNQNEIEIAIRTSKPTPSYTSSTKPEKEAILDSLSYTPKHVKLEVRSDSANALNDIQKITNTVIQDRQILKMNNHATLSSIKYEFDQFEIKPIFTKVKAHDNIYGNERADFEAKKATEIGTPTLPYFNPAVSNTSANTFLHEAGNLVEIYPAHFIKLKDREETRIKLQDKLLEYYNKIFPNRQPMIDWTITKQIASCKSHQQNFLDSRNTFEHKFRINMITKQLPLNKRLFDQKITTTDKCVNCDQIETHLQSSNVKIPSNNNINLQTQCTR